MTARLRAWTASAEFTDAVLLTLGIRLALLVAAPIAVILFGDEAARTRIPLDLWNAWDAPHYFEIAAVGYVDPARAVLFPLLPALLRVGSLLLPPLVAGLLISIAASVAAAIALYRLGRLDGADRRVARGIVLAMSVFPTSFALVPPYTEPLFLAFAAWSVLRARRADWVGAGVLGLLAALTRLPGILLLPALVLELRGQPRTPRMLALALILVGPLVYVAINWLAYGDPLAFIGVQRAVFHVETVLPWQALASLWAAVSIPKADPGWLMIYLAPCWPSSCSRPRRSGPWWPPAVARATRSMRGCRFSSSPASRGRSASRATSWVSSRSSSCWVGSPAPASGVRCSWDRRSSWAS